MKNFRSGVPVILMAGISCSILLMSSPPAFAFWGKRKAKAAKPSVLPPVNEKKVGDIRIFDQPDFMVLFSVYAVKKSENGALLPDKTWSEIGYKLVDKTGEPGKLFGENGWVEIRFQDKDGFNLMTTSVQFKNPKTEYYGFVRIENSRAGQISRVEIKPLKVSEIPVPAPVPSPSVPPSPESSPSPSAPPAPAPEAAKPQIEEPAKPDIEEITEVKEAVPAPAVSTDAGTVVPEAEKKSDASPSPEPENSPADSIITNAVIEKKLQELDKTAPTAVEPSTAPDPSSENPPKENPV